MPESSDHVCPVEHHKSLDNPLRKLIHNPKRILKPFLKEGDIAIDIGCGPGFFTIPMAELTGDTGKVIAVDLQQGMLDIVRRKIRNTPLQERIILHRSSATDLRLTVRADFILLFYVVHEVPDRSKLFRQVEEANKESGKVLIIEPPFHVSREDFERTGHLARDAGFLVHRCRGFLLDRNALLTRKVPEVRTPG